DGRSQARPGGTAIPRALQIDADQVQACVFDQQQGLVPYPVNTFTGYRCLQEYYAFEEKFLFVDVTGLDCLTRLDPPLLQQACGLELRCHIRKTGRSEERRVGKVCR